MSKDKLHICNADGCDNKFRKFKSTDKYCSYSCAAQSQKENNPVKPKNWTPAPMSEKSKEKIKKREEKRKKKQAENALKLRQRAAEKQKKKQQEEKELYLSGKKVNLPKSKSKKMSPIIARRRKMTQEDKDFEKAKRKVKHRVKQEYGCLRCERCKTRRSIQFSVHHIIFRSERPKHPHLNNIRNLLYLCFDCHEWFHKRKRNRDPWIKKLKLWELFGNIWGYEDDVEESLNDK